MDGSRRIRLSVLVATGAWLGVADGLAAVARAGPAAGPWVDRAGTLVASALAAAVAVPCLLAGVRAAVARLLRGPTRSRVIGSTLEALALAGAVALLWIGPYARETASERLGSAVAIGLGCAAAAAAIDAAIRRVARGVHREPRVAVAFALAAFAAAPLAAWPGPAAGRAATSRAPGLVLVSVDTLRPDRLGAYGHPRGTSPNLDALARAGTLFENAFAQSHWTLPSHATMLTGQAPLVHGAVHLDDVLSPALESLAERLRARGFRTAAFVGGNRYSFIGAGRGFDRGFETYLHYPHAGRFRSGRLLRFVEHVRMRAVRHHVGNATAETDAALRWLAVRGDEPFFLFLHFYDVHSKTHRLPYEAPEPWREAFCPAEVRGLDGCDAEGRCATERLRAIWAGRSPEPDAAELERMRCLYDGAVAFVDAQLGRLLDGIDRLGLAERTLVAVTSDHGEAFFEHGYPIHANLFDEVLRVPLILRGPGVPPGLRVAEIARLMDLVPTLLDRLGVPRPAELPGRSLFAGEASVEPPVVVGSSETNSIALRAGGFKLVIRRPPAIAPGRSLPPESLYDLRVDPGESRNLLDGSPPAIAAVLREQLLAAERAQLARGERLRGETAALELPAAERAGLEALGYVETGHEQPATGIVAR
jgi:arylsulfatase A-like enzyme